VILVSKTTLFRIGIVASVLLGVFLLAEGGLRVFLSESRVRHGMARAMGMDVQFEDCSIGLLGGVSLRGLTATSGNGDSLSAQSVVARPRVWACLRGDLKLAEVRVNDVRLVRMEPAVKVAVVTGGGDGTEAKPLRTGGTGPQGVLKLFGMAKQVTVSNAAVDWMKSNGSVRTQIEGADLWYAETGAGAGIGGLSAQHAMWQEVLAVEAVHARLNLNGEALALEDLTAQCGGGKLNGTVGVRFGEQLHFAVSLSADHVDLGKMSQELPSLRLSGQADGRLHMEGLAQAQHTWVGEGELSVTDGTFKGLGVLQMLGQVFQVQELAQLRARRTHSKIRIADKKVLLEGLEIDAGDIQLTAPGVVDFKRGLSLNALISLPEQMIRGKALQLFDKRFSAVDGAGRRSLEFRVTGTLDKPQTDLLEKLVGDNLGTVVGGALGGVVDQFLGGLLKPRKAAKPEAKEEKNEAAAPKPQ
jgi:hypothetical protein